jgi:hypothetical protein
MHKVYPARLTTGEEYTGIQQFQGMGTVRWCCICGVFKEQLGGTVKHRMGGRNWACKLHTTNAVANA